MPNWRASLMKSVRLQLLVTALAVLVTAGLLHYPGLPPQGGIIGAVERGNLAAVYRALAWGANVNARQPPEKGWGLWTPLEMAVEKDCAEMVAALIDRGADVRAKNWSETNWSETTALNYVHSVPVAKVLLDKGADIDAIHVSPAAFISVRSTLLAEAAGRGQRDLVQFLLERGADVNSTSPLKAAVIQGHVEIARSLLAHGANAKPRDGANPLAHVGSLQRKNVKELAELLISHGGDVNSTMSVFDRTGRPFHVAALDGNADLAEVLIAHGAEMDVKTGDGRSPLMMAATGNDTNSNRQGQLQVIELLLTHGADAGGEERRKALKYAVDHRDAALEALLRKHGAKE